MHRDVFSAALRATAKVAFSMALVAGCTATESSDTGASESDIKKGCSDETKKADAAVATNPDAAEATRDAAAPDCAATLASYEANEDKWKADVSAYYTDGGDLDNAPTKPAVSAEAKACCHEEVSKEGWKAPHRASCCENALSWFEALDGGDDAVQTACTPWGPPVPPAMKRLQPTNEVLA